jgi:hypothetical protein
MRLILASLLVVVAALPVSAQWNKNGERAEDAPDRKVVGGFGVHLLVVEKPQEFIEEWKKPEMPKIRDTNKATKGEYYGVIVLFAGCKPDQLRTCNAEVDYTIYKLTGPFMLSAKTSRYGKARLPLLRTYSWARPSSPSDLKRATRLGNTK